MMTSPTGKRKIGTVTDPVRDFSGVTVPFFRDRKRIGTVPKEKRFGFTMTEILVVIIIIAIIAAASTPVFLKATRVERLKSGAKYIASSLKSARSYAIVKRMSYVVNLYLVDSINSVKNAVEIYETPDFKKVIYLPSGVSFTDNSDLTDGIITYTFVSTGQATVTSTPTTVNTVVKVKDSDGRFYRVTLLGFTGQPRVEGPYKSDGTPE